MDTELRIPARPHIGRMVKLFKSPVPRLRAKLARVAGAYLGYKGFIETVLADEDPRVRANAIESLWQSHADRVRELLVRASSDPHVRVRTNAVLGLYRCDVESAANTLAKQATDPDARLRASAAWAMGETKDIRFRDALQTLAGDSEPAVSDRAKLALAGIDSPAEPKGVE